MPLVIKKPRAEQDLLAHFTYIGERNPTAAERFLDAAEHAFNLLAQFPLMGRAWNSDSPRLAGVRSWTIPKFKNYRIFYRPITNGIEVLHVFHAVRDIARILETEDLMNECHFFLRKGLSRTAILRPAKLGIGSSLPPYNGFCLLPKGPLHGRRTPVA
jgi:toxin ParE1/3/4